MFGWRTQRNEASRLREENATLRDQLNKAGADLAFPSGPGEGGVIRPGCQHALEQYQAMKGWVWSAVSLIARRVAGQRVCVARTPTGPRTAKADGDALQPLDSHPILDAVARPRVGTAFNLKFATICSLELTGRQLWFCPVEDGRRVILPIPSHWIQAITKTVYVIRKPADTKELLLPAEDCCHFYYPDPADPSAVLSPLQQLAAAVDTDDSISTCQRMAFRNGLRPGLALRIGRTPDIAGSTGSGSRPTLTPVQRRQIIDAVKTVYRGVMAKDEPLVLDGLIEEVFPIFRGIAEMDFAASAGITKARILQGYSVSPILLGEVEGANRASATVADEIFCACKVNPLIRMLSESMTAEFAPLFGGGLTVWLEFATPRDPETQHKRFALASARGCVTINEVRRHLLNLPDIDGGDVLISASGGGGGLPPAGPEQKAFAELVAKLDPCTLKAIAP